MVRLALCQMEIIPDDPKANFEKIKKFTKLAKNKKAQLIVFPEKCDGIIDDLLYKSSDRIFVRSFQKLCKSVKLYGVLGSVLYKENENIFNRSFFVDNKGKILGHYDKQKLIPRIEDKYATKGSGNALFDTELGKIGLAICLDITNPIIFRDYKKSGAELIICPAMWERNFSLDTLKGIDTMRAAYGVARKITEARAIENEMFIAFCNAAGEFVCEDFYFYLYGHSCVCEPLYGVDSKVNHNKECLLVADVDLNKIKVASQYEIFG